NEVRETVKRVLEAGAVGINIEDSVHETKQLVPAAEQVERLQVLRDLRDSHDVPFVINARTDAFLHAPGSSEDKLAEAVRRGIAYRDVGVDCIYPMGLTAAESIAAFVRALRFPINVMVRKGLPPIADLEKLGVARVSLDGFFEGRKSWDIDWHDTVWGEELERFSAEQAKSIGMLLFGRVTYQGMASFWPKEKGEIADFMNRVPKVVFSRTMEKAEWNNSRLVKSNAEEEVAKLKGQPGKDLFIFGSAN